MLKEARLGRLPPKRPERRRYAEKRSAAGSSAEVRGSLRGFQMAYRRCVREQVQPRSETSPYLPLRRAEHLRCPMRPKPPRRRRLIPGTGKRSRSAETGLGKVTDRPFLALSYAGSPVRNPHERNAASQCDCIQEHRQSH